MQKRPPSNQRRPNSRTRLEPLSTIKENTNETTNYDNFPKMGTPSKLGMNFQVPLLEEELKDDAVVITPDLVFKNAMTSELQKVTHLTLTSEKLTYLNCGNPTLHRLTSLLHLNLSMNKIEHIKNLDPLKNL
jgi:hypothetical protein